MANKMIVRVQSPDHGTMRIETKPTEYISEFFKKVKKSFDLDVDEFEIYTSRNKSGAITSSVKKTLNSYKIRHGDMLYLSKITDNMETDDGSDNLAQKLLDKPDVEVIEDEVDCVLNKMDGRILRPRNEQLCRHGPSHKCLHCVPLEPYDEEYLNNAEPPVKFLSFHSYLRKLTSGVDRGKFAYLENISCRIRPGCTEHPPWPGGICTKCQPNAVTLNRQRYRHIDYVQFENPVLMERFLNYWRKSGNQRIGIMYGTYQHHKDMPLAIKAVVAAIYEPPQISSRSCVDLLEDPYEEAVLEVGRGLGLRPVGWIFTDLIAEQLQQGTVKHFRGNIESHFLSAEECIMAAQFQNKFPNPCRLSVDKQFGSKFATVVVTGNSSNQIHFEGYQVSNQCMALVRDQCLVPTYDAPELGYVKESSSEQYVPDVFYKVKDKYNNEITQLARPLPVEYLLVDLPAAFPIQSVYTFGLLGSQRPFTIQNRTDIGESQDFPQFVSYLQQFPRSDMMMALSDFHVLVYMITSDMLPLRNRMSDLLTAIRCKDEDLLHCWSKSEEWATTEHLISAFTPTPMPTPDVPEDGLGAASPGQRWTCSHCTFHNAMSLQSCEMCSLPKSA